MPLAVALDAVVMTVIGLGALIFFHELGHFVACRLTGTRVEAFSIGFGKEIFGWTRKGTRYRVGLVPLGGYVKMAAENPGEENTGAPDEFPNKPFRSRLFIMANGVIFNFVLAFVLFAWAFGIGVPFPTPRVGQVAPESPAWHAGLREGDLITRIDGKRVVDFGDLSQEIALSDGPVRLQVDRGGATMDMTVAPRYDEELGLRTIGIQPALDARAAEVAPGSPVAKAGGRAGDRILAINGIATRSFRDVTEVVGRLAGGMPHGATELPLTLRVERADGAEDTLEVVVPLSDRAQLGVTAFEGTVAEHVVPEYRDLVAPGETLVSVNGASIRDLAVWRAEATGEPVREIVVGKDDARITREPARTVTERELAEGARGTVDMETSRIAVRPGMAAARAGLETGDRVVRLAGRDVESYRSLLEVVKDRPVEDLEVTVERDGETVTRTIRPGRWPKELGYGVAVDVRIHRDETLGQALATGWNRTVAFGKTVVLTLKSLITQEVSHRQVGGPVTLFQVTYTVFDHGWGKYLYILALISVNLAILNLLPIPILDGGQIVLLCAEKLRGRPLPERVVSYYQLVGLVVLLGILILALSNDIRNVLQ